MNKDVIYSIVCAILGIISLLVFWKKPYSKDDDFGKNFALIAYGIIGIIMSLFLFIKFIINVNS